MENQLLDDLVRRELQLRLQMIMDELPAFDGTLLNLLGRGWSRAKIADYLLRSFAEVYRRHRDVFDQLRQRMNEGEENSIRVYLK